MNTRQTKQKYKQIILNHLLAGKTLSTYEAYDLYNITCFLQRVSELRDQGVTIQDEWVKNNGKRFKRYWIDQPINNDDDASGVQS
ncbi:helix-turn-helix domain-containing protein [Psychrobacter nivimaris]|uniref:helix-turn-helix domain-containing protein n=1 Tax=Psychrobacter nivimaris TaxID=281738 RepID=UPI0019190160|nr:helix-turn-helix domain-containing protein [Psychrobacter nivimaris]